MPAPTPSNSKAEWREHILAGRRAVDPLTRSTEALALSHAAVTSVQGMSTVAAYVSVGSEPGSLDLLDAVRGVGVRILLPIAREPGPLRWAEYVDRDSLVSAPYRLSEPNGPILDASEVSTCDAVLIPALAVDLRGVRLGRGAGFYDRTLDLCAPGALLIAVVRDDELVPELPEEPHDRRTTHALTPGRGLVELTRE